MAVSQENGNETLTRLTARYANFPTELKKKIWIEDGRFCFEITGTGLKGVEWVKRLSKAPDYSIGPREISLITKPAYWHDHRLVPGKKYKLALFEDFEVLRSLGGHLAPTSAELKNFVVSVLGKQATELRAEMALLIREKFTDFDLYLLGYWGITVLHNPIHTFHGGSFEMEPRVLISYQSDWRETITSDYDSPESAWGGGSTCVFPFLMK